MSTIKINRPTALFFYKDDGTFTEVDLEKPFSEQFVHDYPTVVIKYEEGARTLKNVQVEKRNTPKFIGPNGEVDQELIYDIYWEEEEWES